MKQEFVPLQKPGFNFRLIAKIIITTAFITAAAIIAANIFFLEKLAESKIAHIQKMADSALAIISELAISGLETKDENITSKTLQKALEKIRKNQSSFFNISIILYPEGVYYASTNNELYNKKAGRSLLKKIELNEVFNPAGEKINYGYNNTVILVLQFLKNIYTGEQGEKQRIATCQILFDYGEILGKTRENLWKIGGIVYLLTTLIIFIVFAPISLAHREIIKALNEVSRKNFQYALPTRHKNELGRLFEAFNRMTTYLQIYFQKNTKPLDPQISPENSPWNTADTSLRKSDISCLCVRLPEIQDYVSNKSITSITVYINKFLQSFEKGVKEFGGHIAQIMGDKVYATFGGINSVDNAIKAALKINRKWRAFNHENKALNIKQKNYGMGLHHGRELAGTIANPSFGYSFVGQVADIAGSLCSWAEKEQILITSSMISKATGDYPSKGADKQRVHPFLESKDILSLIIKIDDAQKHAKIETLNNEPDSFDMNRESFHSSVADMLEETLKLSPLEEPFEERKKPGAREQGDLNSLDDQEKDSLWDQFDSTAPKKHDTK